MYAFYRFFTSLKTVLTVSSLLVIYHSCQHVMGHADLKMLAASLATFAFCVCVLSYRFLVRRRSKAKS
jgi:phosphoglycerol transferase MdoB-like AlkP superfamily enzyme